MNPQLSRILAESDLLLLLGTRLGDIATSSYRSLNPAATNTRLIHVHPDPAESCHIWPTELAIAAAPEAFLRGLDRTEPQNESVRQQHLSRCQRAYRAWLQPDDLPGKVRMAGNLLLAVGSFAAAVDNDKWRRKLCGIPAPSFPVQMLPDPVGTDFRDDGLRLAGGDRRQIAFP